MSNSKDQRLADRTALVTGSTRGLGRIVVERLAREGARVIVTGRGADSVDTVVSDLAGAGFHALGIEADLASPDGAHQLARNVFSEVERLDILVNNAGMSYQKLFWETTDEDFEYQTNVNYRSPFILSQHAARHMIERGIRGRIVNFSTIGAHSCHADRLVYDAAKGAVEVMTRNMAFELGPYGISVNTVIPGAIAQRPGADGDTEEWRRYARNNIPLGRVGNADDIATTVLFFCLPETEFISGQGLLVDGAHNTWLPESTA